MKKLITIFLLLFCMIAQCQERTVFGVVSDRNETLPGVAVTVKGTVRGTQTDIGGEYSINVKSGDVLVFSYIGYKKMEIAIDKQSKMDVALVDDGIKLQENYDGNDYNRTKIRRIGQTVSIEDIRKNVKKEKLVTITGVIIDGKSGESIPWANIMEKNTKHAVQTDIDGRFSITVKKGKKLEISCLCYKMITIKAKKNDTVRLPMETICHTL